MNGEAAELSRYEPRLEIVREDDRQYRYDAGLVDPADASRIADFFHREFGDDGSPDVFRFPNVDGFYLVSGSQDHRGELDFGGRFFLVSDRGVEPTILFRGRGMGDSYFLDPYFYDADGRTLVLAETGTEYSWGLQAYEFTDSNLIPLGSVDVARWSGENYVNPLERARVFHEQAEYRLEFASDLIVDPGGLREWTLPRIGETIVYRQHGSRFVLAPGSVGNQACFFFFGDYATDDNDEVLSDLLYHYGEIEGWLDENHVAHSFQDTAPLEMLAEGAGEIRIQREDLEGSAGVVLVSADGRTKILHGVLTDTDLVSEMSAFFLRVVRAR